LGNPWEIPRPEIVYDIKLVATPSLTKRTANIGCADSESRHSRMAYDTPVLGYKANTANLLRLWKAELPNHSDFQAFNTGDYTAQSSTR